MATSTALEGLAPRGRSGGWRSSWLEIVLFGAGAGLFALLIYRIGPALIAETLWTLGPALPLIIGVEALAILANTLSWRCTIPPERRGDVPFTRLVAARIVGDAVNYVIPAGAGEVARVRLLGRYVPMELAVASVAVAKVTEGIALGLFGIAGLVVAWPILTARAVSPVTIGTAALGGLALVVGCVAALRAGLLTTVVRLFRRHGVSQAVHVRLREPSMPTEVEVVPRRRGLIASTLWHLLGWLVNVAELWLACHFLGLGASLDVVFAGEALGVLFDAVFFFVPMRIGAAEGGRMFVFRLLGFSAAIGLTLGLARRIRELAWTIAGLAIYPWLARAGGPANGRGTGRDQEGRVVTA
jgi:uncharacterized membrane protein YbhN (UPF0104 family)